MVTRAIPAVEARHLRISARQMHVSRVTVNGEPASFRHSLALERLVPENAQQLRELRTLSAYHCKARDESHKGELQVQLPPDVGLQKDNRFLVRVFYELSQPVGGARFFSSCDAFPHRQSYMYASSREGTASMWFPCLSGPSVRHVFHIYVTCERSLEAVSSGVLRSRMEAEDGARIVHHFSVETPCAARSIFLAVGPFEKHVDQSRPEVITCFCLPGRLEQVRVSGAHLGAFFNHFNNQFGAPFPKGSSLSLVFVEEAPSLFSPHMGGAICSNELLHDEMAVEQRMETSYALATCLAYQWVLPFVQVDDWSEVWIQEGLSRLCGHLSVAGQYGNNQMIWRALNARNKLQKMAPELVARPLNDAAYNHPSELFFEHMSLKTVLVMFTIYRRVKPSHFTGVVMKALFQAPAVHTTDTFIKTIGTNSQTDLSDIQERWINSSAVLKAQCGFAYNVKRNYVEFAAKQSSEHVRAGSLCVRIHEHDAFYDHELELDPAQQHAWDDFPVHTRVAPPKMRKPRKRKKNPKHPRVEPPPQEKNKQAAVPIYFVRVDPEMAWILKDITFRQPEAFWIKQLGQERSVQSQLEAVRGLRDYATDLSARALAEALNDPDVFYGVRVAAALVLAQIASDGQQQARNYLLQAATEQCAREGIMLQNDFTNPNTLHFLKAGVMSAVCRVTESMGENTPDEFLELAVRALAYNDNSTNNLSDHDYLREFLGAAGYLKPRTPELLAQLQEQISRYMELERMNPSPHGAIMRGCLKALRRLQERDVLPIDTSVFKKWSVYGNHPQVRLCALDALVVLSLKTRDTEIIRDTLQQQVLPQLMVHGIVDPEFRRQALNRLARRWVAHRKATQFDGSAQFTEHTPENKAFAERVWGALSGEQNAMLPEIRWGLRMLFAAMWGWETSQVFGADLEYPEDMVITGRPQREQAALLEQERLVRERREQERKEKQRLEEERLERERVEQQRQEREKILIENARIEKEREEKRLASLREAEQKKRPASPAPAPAPAAVEEAPKASSPPAIKKLKLKLGSTKVELSTEPNKKKVKSEPQE